MGLIVSGVHCLVQIQVKLLSSDQQVFDVDEDVAFMSETIKNTLEGGERVCLVPCMPGAWYTDSLACRTTINVLPSS